MELSVALKGRIRISGFKSLDNFDVKGLGPFMVFAGPNASGKSNFFDALRFASSVLNTGAKKAIKEFGGFKSIHCRKRKKEYRKTFNFEIDWPVVGTDGGHVMARYQFKVQGIDAVPSVYEKLVVSGEVVFERDGHVLKKVMKGEEILESFLKKFIRDDQLVLGFAFSGLGSPIVDLLGGVRKFAVDPNAARESNKSDISDHELESNGKNLAAVLNRIEKEDPGTALEICELMGHLVPSIHRFKTEENHLDTSISLNFREVGHSSLFPPGLISDGTIYILCLLVAALTGNGVFGFKLIEEPERGIHPKAVEELSRLFQDEADWDRPIFLTTHSESIIRTCKPDAIVFLNKVNGITKSTPAELPEGVDIPLDEAWLSNMLNGGLPW